MWQRYCRGIFSALFRFVLTPNKPEKLFSCSNLTKGKKKEIRLPKELISVCQKILDGLATRRDRFVSVFVKPILAAVSFESGALSTDYWCLDHCVIGKNA